MDGWKVVIIWQRVVAWTTFRIDDDRVVDTRSCVESIDYQRFSMIEVSNSLEDARVVQRLPRIVHRVNVERQNY